MIQQPHHDMYQPDTDKAWNALHARLQENNLLKTTSQQTTFRRFTPMLKWAVAAVLVIALATVAIRSLLPLRNSAPLLTLQNNDADNTLVKTLDDGSTVYLATSSSLSYPAQFANDSRQVSMMGNAMFDIARNPVKPFRIETDKIIVEVLGTAFNIKTDDKGNFELSVLRGKVKVTQKGNGEIAYVVAGEQATVVDTHWQKTHYANNTLLNAFIRNMRFKDEPLDRIVQVINQNSSRKVALKGPTIKNHKLNVRFYNNDVETMTEVISLALHLTREVRQDSIFISQ
jgi:transmembrane sensor